VEFTQFLIIDLGNWLRLTNAGTPKSIGC